MSVEKSQVRLAETCEMYPEQYDAHVGEDCVGYLRLRHGYFAVYCPGPIGERVLEASPVGDGRFMDDERETYLDLAKEAIAAWVNKNGVPK